MTTEYPQQTHPSPKPIRVFLCGTKNRVASEEDPLLLESRPQDQMEKPTSLRGLLTRDVIITCVNYSFLALVDISFRTLQPVFFSTPLELGGLGIDPPMIGTIMSSFGILNGVFTVFFFSRLLDYLGLKRFYLIGITAAVPSFLLFPVINYLARNSIERSGRLGTEVWLAVGLQVALSVLFFLCYGAFVSARLLRSLIYIDCSGEPSPCTIQALCLFSSPQLHRTRLLWGLRTVLRSYRHLSCGQLDPPWPVHCIRCRSIRSITI